MSACCALKELIDMSETNDLDPYANAEELAELHKLIEDYTDNLISDVIMHPEDYPMMSDTKPRNYDENIRKLVQQICLQF